MRALLTNELFTAHDIWHQVARLYWYNESVSSGVFPPNWVASLANGLGYPLFVFSYHTPWIVGLVFLKLGLSIPATINALFVFSYVVSGLGMYWASVLISKDRYIAFISAVLYLLGPWRFVTILVSAAMGRSFILLLLPFIVVSIYYISQKKYQWGGVFFFALIMSAIILSHLISAMTALLIILPAIVYFKPKRRMIFWSMILTALLTAWYVLPIVSLSKQIQVSSEPFNMLYQNQFISVKQLLYSKWGYGIVNNSATEGAFSYQFGFAQWVVVALTFFLALQRKYRNSPEGRFASMLFSALIFSLFLTTDLSKPLWDSLHTLTTFDYPTMFLMPALVLSSLLIPFVLKNVRASNLVGIALLILAVLNTRNYMRVNQYFERDVHEIVESETTTNSFHEYLPKSANATVLGKPLSEVEGDGVRDIFVRKTVRFADYRFSVTAPETVTLKTLYFPGLRVVVNNKIVTPSVSDDGRISLPLTEGFQQIMVTYE